MMEKNPVCGMSVEPSKAAGKKVREGRTYYFCSAACLKKFEQSPQRTRRERRAEVPITTITIRRPK